MYNKLFGKILDSSIWLEDPYTRIVWITLLAAMDEDGYAHFSAIQNLAIRAQVPLDKAGIAVEKLMAPDAESGDPEHDGRRIERVPGGFVVLNATKYREIATRIVARERTRTRVQKHRANKSVTQCNDSVTQSYTEANTDTELLNILNQYPKRAGANPKKRALKSMNARLKEGSTITEFLGGVTRYHAFCKATGKLNTEFVMQAATFFGPDEHFKHDWSAPKEQERKGPPGKMQRAAESLKNAQTRNIGESDSNQILQDAGSRPGLLPE